MVTRQEVVVKYRLRPSLTTVRSCRFSSGLCSDEKEQPTVELSDTLKTCTPYEKTRSEPAHGNDGASAPYRKVVHELKLLLHEQPCFLGSASASPIQVSLIPD